MQLPTHQCVDGQRGDQRQRMSSIPFANTYVNLPATCFERRQPDAPSNPKQIALNHGLLEELVLTHLTDLPELQIATWFSGAELPPGADPIAQAYAGHQFGNFVPQLGDGRALLLGEVIDGQGRHRDIALKGSGRTVFSRGGDGRAPLGPVLREYVVSEAMHALGVPTTRALAAVTTGDWVMRDRPQPGAVLTRVAQSHLRIGTFQYFAARGDVESLSALVHYALKRHDPKRANSPNPAMVLFEQVAQRQAELVAKWMGLGFIHGVMNTDNCTISGETIDFGPCAFMESYNPQQVFSSIDQQGRYAYSNQPRVAQWNLARLAEALLSLDPESKPLLEALQAGIHNWPERFELERCKVFGHKLGLANPNTDDAPLIDGWLALLAQTRVDFTQAHLALRAAVDNPQPLQTLLGASAELTTWQAEWLARLTASGQTAAATKQQLLATNPSIIPRNHQVEAVITAAVDAADFAPFFKLLAAVTQPYSQDPNLDAYRLGAPPEQAVYQTFCGT